VKYDMYYRMACEDAREDWHYFGILRTDAEVQAEYERYKAMGGVDCAQED